MGRPFNPGGMGRPLDAGDVGLPLDGGGVAQSLDAGDLGRPFGGGGAGRPFGAEDPGPSFGTGCPGHPFGAGPAGPPFGAGPVGRPFRPGPSGRPFGAAAGRPLDRARSIAASEWWPSRGVSAGPWDTRLPGPPKAGASRPGWRGAGSPGGMGRAAGSLACVSAGSARASRRRLTSSAARRRSARPPGMGLAPVSPSRARTSSVPGAGDERRARSGPSATSPPRTARARGRVRSPRSRSRPL